MSFVDILFPLSLGPLTYRCPEVLDEAAEPGMLVSAPIKKSISTGIILTKNVTPPGIRVKEIAGVHGERPLFSRTMIRLLIWMSEYYLATAGLILKQAVPNEMLIPVTSRRSADEFRAEPYDLLSIPGPHLEISTRSLGAHSYQTMLLHAASSLHEISLAASLVRTTDNVLVLFPEITAANRFFNTIRDLGSRTCILHSDMSAGRRSDALQGIISGMHDIVIGTRTALFAPMMRPKLIIIMHEQSGSYKLEDGIRFNARDCAIMRGFLEKIPVMLTSAAPSMESWANAASGKYRLIDVREGITVPKARTIDMRFTKKARPYLSNAVIDTAKRSMKKNEKVLLLINRRGHSTMLHCAECGNTERCDSCSIPLVLHKDGNFLQCHYCGNKVLIAETCGKCHSPRLELLGAGTQKIEEDIRELFGVETVRFDSDKAVRKTEVRAMLARASDAATEIVVGTKILHRVLGGVARFGMAAMLNPDASLNVPDFRAREKAFHEIVAIRDLVHSSGEMLLQTRFSRDPFFKHIRDNDFASFASEELSLRKELRFPPYAKMMDITVSGNAGIADKAAHLLSLFSKEIDILGPSERRTKKGNIEYSILIRHSQRKILQNAARVVLEKIGQTKGVEIRIDVDPY
ncbi:MAG: primosomal protein N' [Nitrospirae bacterium]|nr:primosomal protein N' [Nitrospirota bacterium]